MPVACEWLIGTRCLDYERIYLLATVAAVAASELWSFSHYHRASSSTMLMLLLLPPPPLPPPPLTRLGLRLVAVVAPR